MYSKAVTDEKLREASEKLGFELERHSIADVELLVTKLNEALNDEGKLIRDLSKAEQRFIRNERIVSKLDFRYWCNPPDAPIWMADGSFKPLGEIEIGDRVMGWVKKSTVREKRFDRNFFEPSEVVAVHRRKAPLISVTMESGRTVRCTPDHLWANGASSRAGGRKNNGVQYSYPWIKARIGANLRNAVTPAYQETLSEEKKHAALWLSGIYDGEGSTGKTNRAIQISQYKSRNPRVHQRIGECLTLLGFPYHVSEKGYRIKGGLRARVSFLNLVKPLRSDAIRGTFFSQVECENDKILRIDYHGEEEVVSLQTETGNYVAWGYLSKNCTRYAFIPHYSENKIVRFAPNTAQNILLDIWGMFEEQGRAISIQEDKARQLGVSTITELGVAHRTQFYKHVNAVVGSSDPDKSFKMAQMMERCWQNEPWWLMPRQTKYQSGILIEFGDLDSAVSIQSGAQFTGIARGTTPTVCHLSELADFINPEELVDASLLKAMHESPWTFLVLESTAKGRQNWWHTTWEYSKQFWESGMARLFPLFLPWFIGRDIYPTDTWLKSRPIPSDWTPAQLTHNHAERAKHYVKSNSILRKFLGEDWEMPLEQMWWWEVTRAEYAAKKELAQFYSETPADDLESFQSTNISAFDSDVLASYRENTREPLAVFGFIGRADQIPVRMQPDRRDIDTNMPPINIRAKWNPSIEPFECQLVPLKFHGYPSTDPHGKLFLWEMPEEGEFYGLGVDTSDGVGLDRTVIEVLRKGTIERNDGQVAEFANPYINAFDLWPICMAVGTLYSTEINRTYRQAKMVIECRGNGESTQWELRKHGWTNFHQWVRYDSKKVNQGKAHKLGWFTNSWSRAMMMDELIKAVRDEWIDVNSPYFVNEMADLERDEFRQSLRAVYGGHDDRIMALGFVFFSMHIMEIRGNMHSVAAQRLALRESNQVDPVYYGNFQTSDGPRDWATLGELEERSLFLEEE